MKKQLKNYPFGLFGLSEDHIKLLKKQGLSDEDIKCENELHKKVTQKIIQTSSLLGYGKSVITIRECRDLVE